MENKTREYKKIIRESLIRGGYLKEPSFEDKLEEIINESFEDLDLLLKKRKEKENIDRFGWDIKDINELTDEEIVEYEKCLPDYISGLPGSLRSTDPDVLQTRLDAIDKRLGEIDNEIEEEENIQAEAQQTIDDLTEENEGLQKELDDYHEKRERFDRETSELEKEAQDTCADIVGRWDDFTDDPSPPEELDTLVRGLEDGDMFLTGLLTSANARDILQLADDIDTWVKDVSSDVIDDSGNPDIIEDWVNEMGSLTDDLRDLAETHDVNNSSTGDLIDDIFTFDIGDDLPSDWVKKTESTISSNNNEIKNQQKILDNSQKAQGKKETEKEDLTDNKDKTEQRLSQAERNKYNIP